jgi:hypothetical protein
MPLDTVIVDHIDVWGEIPEVRVFVVKAFTTVGQHYCSFVTNDPLRASLCEQSWKQQIPIAVLWQDTKHGKDIVKVKLQLVNA